MQPPDSPGLPPIFLQKMQSLLGTDYPALIESLKLPPTSGLRANTLKISPQILSEQLPYTLLPVPWCPAGFWLKDTQPGDAQPSPGRHPYHAAGLYYLQEPSAMAAAEALSPQPGERVLDLCAAPGGKTTHLAALMDGRGLLVANEIHPKRAWELAENLERWGARHVVITSASAAQLALRFPAFFDSILVDAPCSGEGMFRKSDEARRDWSCELVMSCALRQAAILEQAVKMIKPGGRLVYSTCTFNPDENERILAQLLDNHPEFSVHVLPTPAGAETGRVEWAGAARRAPEMAGALRLWPHRGCGEGHFITAIQRSHAPSSEEIDLVRSRQSYSRRPREAGKPDSKNMQARQAFHEFCDACLHEQACNDLFSSNRLALVGTYLYALPDGSHAFDDLKMIHPGFWLGTIKGDKSARFEPSHALALGLRAHEVVNTIDLSLGDPNLYSYLRGDVLVNKGENGWVLVTVDHFSLGWGRRIDGRVKNYYPRGLRW